VVAANRPDRQAKAAELVQEDEAQRNLGRLGLRRSTPKALIFGINACSWPAASKGNDDREEVTSFHAERPVADYLHRGGLLLRLLPRRNAIGISRNSGVYLGI
jgi:hypothetical protein